MVVGDLSGKGLSAASEVATVRNMTRYALYSEPGLSSAVNGLNRILVDRGVLTGFATLFIGVYDDVRRTLTYVNCGQEPALVWRCVDGDMVQLPPTGGVLGGFSDESYGEQAVDLAIGDVIAVFTDGLTEVGPHRSKHLQIDGLMALFAQCCTAVLSGRDSSSLVEPATAVVAHVIAGVEAHAGESARIQDDIALLVGVVVAGPQDDAPEDGAGK